MDTRYLYLFLMGASLSVPLLRSFEPRIAYYRSFRELFTGIFAVGAVFLIWDIVFTRLAFWGFNPRYLSGIYLMNLPLGEWLFFLVIPFVCVFIYRVLNYFFPRHFLQRYQFAVSGFLMGFSGAMAAIFYDRWYTVLTFGLLFLLLLLHQYVWKTSWLGDFFRAYAVILIPFFIVNGILTGSGIEEEIVWYNEAQMIGWRIFTVPFEDAFYGMSLILGVTTIYEYLRRK